MIYIIISYTGVNNKAKVTGAIVFNPVDGSSKKYASSSRFKIRDFPIRKSTKVIKSYFVFTL